MAGGVWLNLGSAVVLPEVFLKAVSIARNLGRSLDGLTTANLDFDQKYRGLLNVLQRPGAEGIALTGHHELMIPLLHAAVVGRARSRPSSRRTRPPSHDDRRLLPEPDRRHGDGHAGLPRPAAGFPGATMLGVIKPHVAPTLDGDPWFDERDPVRPEVARDPQSPDARPSGRGSGPSGPTSPSCSRTRSARRCWPGRRASRGGSATRGAAGASC